MRIVRASGKFVASLNPQERDLFLEVLRLYPRVPPAHQPLSKASRVPEARINQQLLDDALAEQRASNKRQVEALIGDPSRWSEHKGTFRLTLSREDLEWLLQVLNDVRVGSWVRLGSPENLMRALSDKTFHDFWAMELSGRFQELLLQALEKG